MPHPIGRKKVREQIGGRTNKLMEGMKGTGFRHWV